VVEPQVDLSVILPCYNEAQILKESVATVQSILDPSIYRYEIIIAEDASTDGTDKIAKKLSEQWKNVVWCHRDKRLGRGSAVANAIKEAKGKIVGFLDPDLEAPAHYILPLALAIQQGADISIGVRHIQLRKVDFILKLHKVLSHYGYRWISQVLLGTELQDTESGFKFFNRERILPVLVEIIDQHWFWDTEVMVRSYLKGYSIKEIPIIFSMRHDRKSKVNFIKDSVVHFKRLLDFRREIKAKRDFEK
jgi:glycosyltransferase involved in cell wall biosynthesis